MVEKYVAISIDEPYERELNPDWLEFVIDQALEVGGISGPVEVSLLIVDDDTIWDLNRQYRGIDAPTDVLAFSLQETRLPEPGETVPAVPAFPAAPDGITRLGEVIVSFPRAVEQANAMGHSTRREVAILVIHGVLHLLGYDHEQLDDERIMHELEREALRRVEAVS